MDKEIILWRLMLSLTHIQRENVSNAQRMWHQEGRDIYLDREWLRYPLWTWEWPRKIHFKAFGSNFVFWGRTSWTKQVQPNILGGMENKCCLGHTVRKGISPFRTKEGMRFINKQAVETASQKDCGTCIWNIKAMAVSRRWQLFHSTTHLRWSINKRRLMKMAMRI